MVRIAAQRQIYAATHVIYVDGSKVTQSVNPTSDLCCTLREWQVSPLCGNTEFYADAAFSTLRAHAAEKSVSYTHLTLPTTPYV